MSIIRSILLCCLISLLAGVALFFLGSAAGYEQFKGGYAVLTVDGSIEDRFLRGLLEKGIAFFGGVPVSESTQWVMLDEFGSVTQIPLDKYSSRVFPFDPRNDGYAAKLKDFFVRDGKRFVFVPLLAGNWTVTYLDKQFKNFLQDIPFSVDYFGIGRPLSLFFIMYGAAALCLIIICYAKNTINHRIINIFTLIPVLSSLAFFGASGIAAASVLYGFFFLLKEPLNELAMMKGLFSKTPKGRLYKEIYKPYTLNWNTLPLFFIALGILVLFSPLKLLFLTAVFFASLSVFYISSKILSNDEGSRRRFTPVTIVKRKSVEFAFYIYMLPFTIAAFVLLFLTPFMSGTVENFTGNTGGNAGALLSEQDYYDHLLYQASFSTRQMETSDYHYDDYMVGEGGLPSLARANNANQTVNLNDFPLFPLKHLMDFFINVNNDRRINSQGKSEGVKEQLSLLVLLLFVFHGLIVKKNNMPKVCFSVINKAAGKLRTKGLSMKIAFASNKNSSKIRKDA